MVDQQRVGMFPALSASRCLTRVAGGWRLNALILPGFLL